MDENAIFHIIKPLWRPVSLQTCRRCLVVRNTAATSQFLGDLCLAKRGYHGAAAGRAGFDAVAVLDSYSHKSGLAWC